MLYIDNSKNSILYINEIILTEIEYDDGKVLDKLILLTEDVDLYGDDEKRISIGDVEKSHRLKFYYFDTTEYLLKEDSKIKPYIIYDSSI